MNTIENGSINDRLNPKWEVVEFEGNSNTAKTIMRVSDNTFFSLGDVVTNGTKMKGKITKFEFSFRGSDVFVYTDWSGVGMNFDSINHAVILPSKFQLSEKVSFNVQNINLPAYVIAVHFLINKVKYDLEFYEGRNSTRIYNIEERLISDNH